MRRQTQRDRVGFGAAPNTGIALLRCVGPTWCCVFPYFVNHVCMSAAPCVCTVFPNLYNGLRCVLTGLRS